MTDATITAIATAAGAAAIPTLAVLFAAFINNRNHADLRVEIRADMTSLRGEFRSEIQQLRGELNAFRVQVHQDILTLVNLHHDLDKRVTRLEDSH